MTPEASSSSRFRRRTFRTIVLSIMVHAIGLVVLVWLLSRISLADLADAFERFGWVPFVGGLALVIFLFGCKSLRWMLISRALGARMGPGNAFVFYTTAVLFSMVTPGRVGDFVKAVFLERSDPISLKRALLATFADRLWDVLVVGCFGLASLVVLGGLQGAVQWAMLLAVVALPVLFFVPELWGPVLRRLLRLVRPLEARTAGLLDSLTESILLLRGLVGVLAMGLTVLGFLSLVAVAYLFVLQTQEPLDLARTGMAVSLANILSFLPISIAGIGTRELVYTQVWSSAGRPEAPALAVSLGYFLVVYLGTSLLGGVLYLCKARKIVPLSARREIQAQGSDASMGESA